MLSKTKLTHGGEKNPLSKISSILLLLILLTGSLFASAPNAKAAGGFPNYSATSNKTTAIADGHDSVAITLFEFNIRCYHPNGDSVDGFANESECETLGYINPTTVPAPNSFLGFIIQVSGSENTLSNNNFFITDSSGKTTVELKSTKAEKKTVKLIAHPGGNLADEQFDEIAVEFTAPATTPTVVPTTTKKTTTVTPATPAKPTLTLSTTARIDTNDQSSTLDTTKPISILPTQKLTYSGTTSPNAKVTLTIKSDPITKEVTADANGAWTFTLDPKELALETGDHTVSAIATDDKGVASDSVELAKFTLREEPAPIASVDPYKFKASDLLTPINYALGGLLTLSIAGVIYLDILRRRKDKLNINSQIS